MIFHYNINLLQWYFTKDVKDTEYTFQLLTMASMEEPYCFMRILLYIANTRHTDLDEKKYHTILHFMCIMYPEWIMSNLDLLTNLGEKYDALYIIQSKVLTDRCITWIKHKAKSDSFYEKLLSDVTSDEYNISDVTYLDYLRKRKLIVLYKPKFGKNYKWSTFLEKILNDSTFNGITI